MFEMVNANDRHTEELTKIKNSLDELFEKRDDEFKQNI